MAQSTFKIGDVVQTESGGGPAMTVLRNSGFVTCSVYNPVTGKYEESTFPPEALRLVEDEQQTGGYVFDKDGVVTR